ncbi:ubiquitin-protein ligase, putative [Plasmodium gallinaceum]|uniref:Ubiquitin-protein ligase, putative n=1 Tax=Plasmodium gallinaceum TaxID=5849 RepID=A0A1J1GVP5_PLAGA|nr:ubiquitin-protein ligase, putative [Plasmodium gallinaceum]CRG95354.1 ubiquitin-protein ligase, putative [Plasmodium gallinaceum]
MQNFDLFLIFLFYIINKTYCYDVIENNTKFLLNKKPQIDKFVFSKDDIYEDDKIELKILEQNNDINNLEFLNNFFKNENESDIITSNNQIYDDNKSSTIYDINNYDIYSNNSSNSSNYNDRNSNDNYNNNDYNENDNNENDNNQNESNRKKLFNLAVELKNGSKNVKKNIRKSIKIFKELTNVKDNIASSSYYELGKIFFIGYKNHFFCYKRNLNLSLYYLDKSAKMKNAAALHFLSFIYFFDFHETQKRNNNNNKKEKKSKINKSQNNLNYLKKSIEFEIIASLLNYTPSILSLAYKYLYGINVKQNCNKAKNYYKTVAENVMNSDYINIPLSELDVLNVENLNIHNEINNLQNNEEEILEFLNEQIKGGDVMAMYDLGKKYKEEKNFKKAFQYINEASKKNNILALKELGIIYLYGNGTERNIKKSIENFSKAAEAGDVESKCYLGYIYYFIDGYKNLKLSLKYLIEAANHDYGEAFFFLAEIILDTSIQKRYISDSIYKIVFKLYEHSADLGYIQAYFREAQLYEIGKGVKQSCLNATLSYKFIAESTLWINKIRQGMNYYLEKDYLNAFFTYALAAYEGYEVAQNNLIYIYKKNKLNKYIKQEKIMQILNLLYKQGNYKALFEIGEIYKKKNNEKLSVSYYKMGLKKGDLRNLLPLSIYYEKNKNNDRALKYISYFIKQKKREKEVSNTKMEKLKNIIGNSLLYFRKYKLLLKNLYNSKKEKKN